MSRIAENHPTSPLAERYGKRTAKEIATKTSCTETPKKAIKNKRKINE